MTGSTPMVTMDGCSGVMLYLSAQCLADDVSVVSSKCSEINVILPAKVPAPGAAVYMQSGTGDDCGGTSACCLLSVDSHS